MLPNDRPGIEEKYGRAMTSSHLEVSNERTGDVDLLIAAGWIKAESLGTRLFRLRHEFDATNEVELRNAASSMVSRVLTMMQLGSLRATRDALGMFALRQATLERFMRNDATVLAVAGRALDHWLDPMCPACDGRGFHGGPGQPRVMCTECGGSTHRRLRLSAHDDGQAFGRHLMNCMDRKTDYVAKMILRFTAQRAPT